MVYEKRQWEACLFETSWLDCIREFGSFKYLSSNMIDWKQSSPELQKPEEIVRNAPSEGHFALKKIVHQKEIFSCLQKSWREFLPL